MRRNRRKRLVLRQVLAEDRAVRFRRPCFLTAAEGKYLENSLGELIVECALKGEEQL